MDMINRLKQNRAQRPSNRAKFRENNREGIYTTHKEPSKPQFKAVSKSTLQAIKKQIRKRALLQHKKERLVYGIFFICGFILLIAVLIFLR